MKEIAIKRALISTYYKDNLQPLVKTLHKFGVEIVSTGGTKKYIEDLGYKCVSVESITNFSEILGGRVKTLHPAIFGGILAQKTKQDNLEDLQKHNILPIDLVIVDLYPFEEAVATTDKEADIIEKIDIGGVALLRAAAKNFTDITVIADKFEYAGLVDILNKNEGKVSLKDRKLFATKAFATTSHYDISIFNYFNRKNAVDELRQSYRNSVELRYGENPHQKAAFYGESSKLYEQLHGKEISYNNLLDIDAAISLIREFRKSTCAIFKHNNPCGVASRSNLPQAYIDALAGDPVSAFGGIVVFNKSITKVLAEKLNEHFYEIIIATGFDADALELLKTKKNRILLKLISTNLPDTQVRTIINGLLVQNRDNKVTHTAVMQSATETPLSNNQKIDLEFADKIAKHTKSNAIVIAKDEQLCGIGMGQPSRIDALNQAIEKAKKYKFDINGAVMASDGFFPFADSVEVAYSEGISCVIQPGGSIRDKESINFCNEHKMAMVLSGKRHFKH